MVQYFTQEIALLLLRSTFRHLFLTPCLIFRVPEDHGSNKVQLTNFYSSIYIYIYFYTHAHAHTHFHTSFTLHLILTRSFNSSEHANPHAFQLKPADQKFDPKNKPLQICIESIWNINSENNPLFCVEKKEEHLKDNQRRYFSVQSIWIVMNGVCSSVIVVRVVCSRRWHSLLACLKFTNKQ